MNDLHGNLDSLSTGLEIFNFAETTEEKRSAVNHFIQPALEALDHLSSAKMERGLTQEVREKVAGATTKSLDPAIQKRILDCLDRLENSALSRSSSPQRPAEGSSSGGAQVQEERPLKNAEVHGALRNLEGAAFLIGADKDSRGVQALPESFRNRFTLPLEALSRHGKEIIELPDEEKRELLTSLNDIRKEFPHLGTGQKALLLSYLIPIYAALGDQNLADRLRLELQEAAVATLNMRNPVPDLEKNHHSEILYTLSALSSRNLGLSNESQQRILEVMTQKFPALDLPEDLKENLLNHCMHCAQSLGDHQLARALDQQITTIWINRLRDAESLTTHILSQRTVVESESFLPTKSNLVSAKENALRTQNLINHLYNSQTINASEVSLLNDLMQQLRKSIDAKLGSEYLPIVQDPSTVERFIQENGSNPSLENIKLLGRLEAISHYFRDFLSPSQETHERPVLLYPVRGDGNCFCNAAVIGILNKMSRVPGYSNELLAILNRYREPEGDYLEPDPSDTAPLYSQTFKKEDDFNKVIETINENKENKNISSLAEDFEFASAFSRIIRYLIVKEDQTREIPLLEAGETAEVGKEVSFFGIGPLNQVFNLNAVAVVLEQARGDVYELDSPDPKKFSCAVGSDEVVFKKVDQTDDAIHDTACDFLILLKTGHFYAMMK